MALPLLPSLFFLTLLLFTAISEAREFLVGGSTNAWKVPSPTSVTLNQWAESSRFQVGDSLGKFPGHHPSTRAVNGVEVGRQGSVLQVSRSDYLSCNTSSPIADYREGTAVVKLDRSGPYYFISGANGACDKGEKVAVVVMAERRHHYRLIVSGGLSPAPSPMGFDDDPALAPTSGGSRKVVGLVMDAMVGLEMAGLFL